MIKGCGARRVVALSSTSLFVKNDSSDQSEKHIACCLAEGEHALRAWAEAHGVEWVILRPTLIYGRGRDKNLTEIIRFVRRWGFFPLLGKAVGLRQPVHAEDVAAACVSALTLSAVANRTYTL
ncbi:MAG: NAD-dependent epimerase/dehydratase family protein, partial [Nitrospira sp.]|nr:NAD-dependent epimerase/dehydratase family protein [Nitrospira sp.]